MEGASSLLRVATAGSVDDGKSTLIGRLLHDSEAVPADQMDALRRTAERQGRRDIDLSLLTDGLTAEREQGITIDVAYRYFSTATRKFILADVPGHEQYTRNMVTGASTADAVVILVDALKGITRQTRRHVYLASLLGVRHHVVAVNKMDLVGHSERDFGKIRDAIHEVYARVESPAPDVIPLSAVTGDNVVHPSRQLPWYGGPPLLSWLEARPGNEAEDVGLPLRFPVQLVQRHRNEAGDLERHYLGRIETGSVRVGDPIVVAPSGLHTRVRAIRTHDQLLPLAQTPQSIAIVVSDDIDIGRGDILAGVDHPPVTARHLEATICWFADVSFDPRRRILLRHGTRTVPVRIDALKSKLDFETLETESNPPDLERNDVADVGLTLATPVAFDRYRDNRRTGGFLLIDEQDGATLGAGMIRSASRG